MTKEIDFKQYQTVNFSIFLYKAIIDNFPEKDCKKFANQILNFKCLFLNTNA